MRVLPAILTLTLLCCVSCSRETAIGESATMTEAPEVGTPPGTAAPAEGARAVVAYKLSAKLDAVAHTVAGSGTLAWTNTSGVPVRELWFHLYLNAFKNQRSVFLREPLGSGRGGGAVTEWGTIDVRRMFWREANAELWGGAELRRPNDEDETDARVPLPRPVAPGETITLEMTWDDKLPNVIERTGHAGSFHFVAQWFPKIARLEEGGTWAHFPFHRLSEFYADFGSYDVTLDVPRGFVVGATGVKAEEREAGERSVVRFTQNDVHDFAWTAWDGFRVHEERIGNVAVRSLYPAGYERVAARAMESLTLAIPHFEARYGPYPYPTLTVVHPPERANEAGGMEYPTLITTGGYWWTPAALQSIEGVTIHEFGHQYFYGLLASNENRHPFLDEGLNTYAEYESMRAFYGPGAMFDGLGLRIEGAAIAATFGDEGSLVQAVGAASPEFPTFDLYGRMVYVRTAAILETTARVYGREKLEAAFRDYTRAFRFAHPKPSDFFDFVARSLGPAAGDNLRSAITNKGWVDYQVLGISSRRQGDAAGIFDRDGKRETVTPVTVRASNSLGPFECSVLVGRKGTLTFPVDVDVTFEDGSTQRVSWDAATATTRLTLRAAQPVRFVHIDPERRVLLDGNPRNNFARAADAARAPTSHGLERLVYWSQNFLGLVAP